MEGRGGEKRGWEGRRHPFVLAYAPDIKFWINAVPIIRNLSS